MTFTLYSGCKVNLFLEIKERLENGYHLLASLFYPLPYPRDTLYIEEQEILEFQLESNKKELEQNNILEKIFNWFKEQGLLERGYKVFLEKQVPVGAGLGGGSANGAVFLNFLNSRISRKFSLQELREKIAPLFGADLPFFLWNQAAWVEGIGEKIYPLSFQLKDLRGILICPECFVSTAWAYKTFDKFKNNEKTCLTLPPSLNKKSVSQGRLVLFNSFEPVVFSTYPELRNLKEEMLAVGAGGGIMSGSGSAMFFLFREKQKWEKALSRLEQKNILHYSYTF